jgi:hypothetical protein
MHRAIDGPDKLIEKKKQFHILFVFNTEQILAVTWKQKETRDFLRGKTASNAESVSAVPG